MLCLYFYYASFVHIANYPLRHKCLFHTTTKLAMQPT